MAILGRSIPNHVIISQGASGSAGINATVVSGPPDRRYRQVRKATILAGAIATKAPTPNVSRVQGIPVGRINEAVIWQPLPQAPIAIAAPTPNALVIMPLRQLPRPGQPIISRGSSDAAPPPPGPGPDADFCAASPLTSWHAWPPETSWTVAPPVTSWTAQPPEEC